MPRIYRGAALGAAALIVSAGTGAVLAIIQGERCGLHPVRRFACHTVRRLGELLEHASQPF